MQAALLNDIEHMQSALPTALDDVSEAHERRARIVTMLARAVDVMSRLQQRKDQTKTAFGDPQERQALISDIEQKLARLAAAETAPQASGAAER